MFETNSKLKEKIAGLESSLEISAADLTAAQTELSEALKAKEELFAQVEAANLRAEKAEEDAKAAQDLLEEAQSKVDEAEKAIEETEAEKEQLAQKVNRQASALVASVGTEPIPSANIDEGDAFKKRISSLTGREKLAALFSQPK